MLGLASLWTSVQSYNLTKNACIPSGSFTLDCGGERSYSEAWVFAILAALFIAMWSVLFLKERKASK